MTKCPKCGSTKVIHVQQFDHIKMCMNPKCTYLSTPEAKKNNWKYQWSEG